MRISAEWSDTCTTYNCDCEMPHHCDTEGCDTLIYPRCLVILIDEKGKPDVENHHCDLDCFVKQFTLFHAEGWQDYGSQGHPLVIATVMQAIIQNTGAGREFGSYSHEYEGFTLDDFEAEQSAAFDMRETRQGT